MSCTAGCGAWPCSTVRNLDGAHPAPTTHPEADTIPHAPSPLPPYTGEEGRCRKCGATCARTQYQPAASARQLLYDDNGRPRRGPLPERLERECVTCEYQWDEAVLDHTPKEAR
ncbi:hypothetical protein [Streptomyces sp. CA-253872]|uniref:hypothetical protein n=1 Tax=Streptomyces sp. CA-253872 TaxID=3240067 RepID=UPI003D8AFB11